MDTKKLIRILLLIITSLTITSCASIMGGIENVADPYSKKLKCPAGEGFDCLDIEKTYKKDELLNTSTPSGLNKAVLLGEPTELTIGNPMANTYENILEETFKTNGSELDIQKDIDPATEKAMSSIVQTGSTQSATDRLVAYIQAKKFFPDMEAKILRSIAENYSNCIKEANNANEKKLEQATEGKLNFTEEDAVANLRHCSVYLKSAPGLVPYRSNAVSEKLKIQRETETQKYISSTVNAGQLPIRVPPKTIQIRICAYPDDQDILIKDHHIYTMLGEGKWLIQRTGAESNKTVKPLN